MSGAGFIRIDKLKKWPKFLAAARHNYRTIEAELDGDGHIDPSRTHRNYRLIGPATPEQVVVKVDLALSALGYKTPRNKTGSRTLRSDAVLAIELIFSLPAHTSIDDRQYFVDCIAWTGSEFGGEDKILTANVHLDEGAPHCHILVLPLINGRMIGSDLVGGGKVFQARLVSFFEAVPHTYGLCRPSAKPSGKQKQAAAAAVLAKLRELDDPALRSAGFMLISDSIKDDPRDWLSMLDIEMPASVSRPKPMRSMCAIFTSTGKGPKHEVNAATL